MNRYLLKIAEMSAENKQVLKTFGSSWGASIPADLAGAALGSRLGQKFKGFATKLPFTAKPTHFTGGEIGGALGALGASGIVELAAIKHSLRGKVRE